MGHLLLQNSEIIKQCSFVEAELPQIEHRAYVRQRSRRLLDLLNPSPHGWTDEDLAIGLSRTYRWGGHSQWPLPLSVAQHSLLVMQIYQDFLNPEASEAELLRELLHDADEALIGGFDPISPLKPMLGDGYVRVVRKLRAAVFERYAMEEWDQDKYRQHKRADNLAAASEAVHVAGWSNDEVVDLLKIALTPLKDDPLAKVYQCRAWEPWTPAVAAQRFLDKLLQLQKACFLHTDAI